MNDVKQVPASEVEITNTGEDPVYIYDGVGPCIELRPGFTQGEFVSEEGLRISALSRAPAEWVEIDQIPEEWKDGRRLLMFNAVSFGTAVGFWHSGLELWCVHPETEDHTLSWWPTHCQPLPTPPRTEE